jgi:hypothetical protein
MRRLFTVALMGLMFLGVAPRTATAWGKTGHRVVAAIAWANMTPAARAAAIKLLNAAPASSEIAAMRPTTGTAADRDREWFIDVATWPDLVRAGVRAPLYSHPDWHFADHYWKLVDGHPVSVATMGPGAMNSVERLTVFSDSLKVASLADSNKAIELAWVMHLVGDVHQPLHNSSEVTAQFPAGDRGGNTVVLHGTLNLHNYWDDILDEVDQAEPGTMVAKKAREAQPAYIETWASSIMTKFPKSGLPLAGPLTAFDAWSHDGFVLAEEHAYTGIVAGEVPSAAYRGDVANVAERAIAEGGYRLARLLNSILS